MGNKDINSQFGLLSYIASLYFGILSSFCNCEFIRPHNSKK